MGNFLGGVMIFCIVAGLVLSMNTATMDGSRALYGIAKDGMTIREFAKLNRFRVPALAMTVDALLNVVLISFFNNPIEIIAVSNIGYVFATCAALSGFLLLRKDRPRWPRPVNLSAVWVPLGAVLLAANFVFLIAGGFIYSGGFLGIEGYGYGWDKTRWGLLVLLVAIALYLFRQVVQDKQPIRWREDVPATPEESGRIPSSPRSEPRRSGRDGAPRGPVGTRSRLRACASWPSPTGVHRLTPRSWREQLRRRRRGVPRRPRPRVDRAARAARPPAHRRARQPRPARRCCARSRSTTSTAAARRSAG